MSQKKKKRIKEKELMDNSVVIAGEGLGGDAKG